MIGVKTNGLITEKSRKVTGAVYPISLMQSGQEPLQRVDQKLYPMRIKIAIIES
jgi:hypothetical protein